MQFCVLPPRRTRCGSQVTIAVPRPGLQPLARLRAAAGAEHGRRDRPAHRSAAARTPTSRAPPTAAAPSRPRVADLGRGVRARRSRARAAASRWSTARPRCAPACSPPDGSERRAPRARRSARSSTGVFTDIAAQGEEVLAAGSDAQACATPSGSARAAIPNNAAAWQQLDPAPAAASPSSPVCPAASRSCSSRRRQRRQPVRAAPRGRGLVAARRGHRRPSPTTASQLAGNAKGRLTALRHLLRLPPRLHRPRPTAASCGPRRSTSANFERVPVRRSRCATNATGAASPRSPTPSAPRSVRVTRFTPAHRAGRRAGALRGARVQVRSVCDGDRAVARRRDRARQPPGRAVDRPAPRPLRPRPRRAPRLPRPRSARATTSAAAPRASRCASPRAAARRARCACASGAAARRADVRAQRRRTSSRSSASR